MRRPVLLLCLLLAPLRGWAADLAAHHALYALTMGARHSDSVTAARGTMSYDVVDACDAWTVRQRLDMVVTNDQGQDVHMLSDYATWESKDGLKIRFHSRQTNDATVTDQVDGEASLRATGGAGEVRYTTPANSVKPLPAGTLFPMMHTAALLQAAEAGRRFFAAPLFDGTGEDGAQDTFVTITSWAPHAPTEALPPLLASLATLPSGVAHVAFFTRGGGAATPDYEVAMRYWANGVANALEMDFGDFLMDGQLDEFQLTPGHC